MDVSFSLNGMLFEYDENKNQVNIKKHGISFEMAARVFLDFDRIEMFDEENSVYEDRYNTIGNITPYTTEYRIDNNGTVEDVLFVVYTERERRDDKTVIRMISARRATSFERGLYYGKYR